MDVNNSFFGRIQLQHLSVNKLIQWGDHLSVDHPGIDAQHKAIYDLGSRVYEDWRSGGSSEVLRQAVDKLAILLKAHFSYEERLLAEIGYDGLKEHAAEHRIMINEIGALQGRFRALKDDQRAPGGSLMAPGWSVMQFILGFSIGHVMSSDMAYCQTLADSRNRVQGTA